MCITNLFPGVASGLLAVCWAEVCTGSWDFAYAAVCCLYTEKLFDHEVSQLLEKVVLNTSGKRANIHFPETYFKGLNGDIYLTMFLCKTQKSSSERPGRMLIYLVLFRAESH